MHPTMPGGRCRSGVSRRHRADTGGGVGPWHGSDDIEVCGLRKRFGPALALDGMTFTVLPGPGHRVRRAERRGKSTTMRVILGLDTPDEGTALIGGRPLRQSCRTRSATSGSLLDAAALQPGRTARNHLLWLAHSQGFPARRVDEVAEQAGLGPVMRRKAGGFSLGMRQRLGLAAAMLGDPPVAAARRAVQRAGPRGHRLDARAPARAGGAGPGGAGVQPPDERARGHRGPPGRGRPRQGDRRHQRGGADRRRLRRAGAAAHGRAGRGGRGVDRARGRR